MEYVGFIVSLLALVYLFFKQQMGSRNSKQQQKVFDDEDQDNLNEEFEELTVIKKNPSARVEVKYPPSVPPKYLHLRQEDASLLQNNRLESQEQKRRLKNPMEIHPLVPQVKPRLGELRGISYFHEEGKQKRASRAAIMIGHLRNKQDLIIYREIIDKPISMRPFL